MANLLDVSTQTIRRDIKTLEQVNLPIRRYHGGVTYTFKKNNRNLEDRKNDSSEIKAKIATKVASLIPDNSSVFLSNGTTTEAIANALLKSKNKLRIITPNLHNAMILHQHENFDVSIPSGTIRSFNGCIIDVNIVNFLENFRCDFTVTSIGAIDTKGNLFDYEFYETQIVQKMIECSRSSILAFESYKLQQTAAIYLGNLKQFDWAVCDNKTPNSFKSMPKESLHVAN